LAGYIPRWYTRSKTVTHPGTNRVRRALTSFMLRTPLTTTPRRQPKGVRGGQISRNSQQRDARRRRANPAHQSRDVHYAPASTARRTQVDDRSRTNASRRQSPTVVDSRWLIACRRVGLQHGRKPPRRHFPKDLPSFHSYSDAADGVLFVQSESDII